MLIVLNTLNYESVPSDGLEFLLLFNFNMLQRVCIFELGQMFYFA